MHKANFNSEILFAADGETLSQVLMRYGKAVEHPCGGRGVCGKCTVTVNGREELSCRYKVKSDIEVVTAEKGEIISPTGAVESKTDSDKLCFVLDIGTTTLALALVATDEKKIIKTVTATNPQRAYGADVISRIEYCRKNSAEVLQKVLVEAINNMSAEFDVCKVDMLYASGNTTMLHLLLGEDCSKMGVAPYTPAFLEAKCVDAHSLGIKKADRIETIPCIAAFMGADITAGLNFIGTPRDEKYSLLVDLGTNAEIVLLSKNGSVSTSAAAGPCFEGANISCGMSAVEGAISGFKNGEVKTIGNKSPVGICGTGLIEIVAYLLENDIVDKTGYMECERFEVAENIFITQEDIRQYQLAKSAVFSAIMALVKYNNITLDSIEQVYLSGGFSAMADIKAAVRTGLLPEELEKKCVCINNSSLLGTVKYACEKNDLENLAKKTKYIDLSADAFFSDMFIENMMF